MKSMKAQEKNPKKYGNEGPRQNGVFKLDVADN